MSSSRRSSSKAEASKDAPVPASPEKTTEKGKKRKPTNEAEAAASDAAKEMSDMAESTEPTPSSVPAALLQRRLVKSNAAVEQLQKEKADMAKKLEEMREEVKAAKLAKVVESASPGEVVQVAGGRQVFHICCLQDYRVKIVMFCLQKARATVKTAPTPQIQAPIPTSTLYEALSVDGSYKRAIQSIIVPQSVAVQGFRWHHAVHRRYMHAITRARTIAMGGKYAHWDVLDARSNESGKAEKLLMNLSNTHFHAYAQHRDVLRGFCSALFELTTCPEMNAVKLEAFGVADGFPILRDPAVIAGTILAVDTDHPVMIALSKAPLPTCYTQRVLFEQPKCAGTISTALHNRTLPEQKKFSALLGDSRNLL